MPPELLDLAIGDLGQADGLEHLADAPPARRQVVQSRELGQRVEHLRDRLQAPGAEFLRQIAEQPAHRAAVGDDVEAVHGDAARRRHEQRADDAHQRALAGSVGPEQAEQPRADLEVDVVEGDRAASVNVPHAVGYDHGAHRFASRADFAGIISRRSGPERRRRDAR